MKGNNLLSLQFWEEQNCNNKDNERSIVFISCMYKWSLLVNFNAIEQWTIIASTAVNEPIIEYSPVLMGVIWRELTNYPPNCIVYIWIKYIANKKSNCFVLIATWIFVLTIYVNIQNLSKCSFVQFQFNSQMYLLFFVRNVRGHWNNRESMHTRLQIKTH